MVIIIITFSFGIKVRVESWWVKLHFGCGYGCTTHDSN